MKLTEDDYMSTDIIEFMQEIHLALIERIRIDDGGDPRTNDDPSWDQPYN